MYSLPKLPMVMFVILMFFKNLTIIARRSERCVRDIFCADADKLSLRHIQRTYVAYAQLTQGL